MSAPETNTDVVYDASTLAPSKRLLLGVQHLFAMFGATVLVPALTGLDVANALLFAGLGTLLFHLITGRKIPAFLGSSFAFIGGYNAIRAMGSDGGDALLPYACFGVACAGLVYLVLAFFFKQFGAKKVMRYFPPIVTGPIIICIGLTLSGSAVTNCANNWWVALVAILIVVGCNIWGKGMVKIIPILLGVVGAYLVAVIANACGATVITDAATGATGPMLDFSGMADAPILGFQPFVTNFTGSVAKFDISAILVMAPIAIASMMEHIGDMSAISATVGENFIEDPGLHRTLIGDGIATSLAGLFGGPANTTYGENTGVLALSKIYDPLVIRIAAVLAIILSFSPKFEAVINTIPTGIIGGISFVLYGMISAIGVRNVVENRVDFTNSRNLIVAAVILVCALGFNSVGGVGFTVGSVTINLSGLAVAAIAGILLNAILPGNDYEFDATAGTDAATSGNLQV